MLKIFMIVAIVISASFFVFFLYSMISGWIKNYQSKPKVKKTSKEELRKEKAKNSFIHWIDKR